MRGHGRLARSPYAAARGRAACGWCAGRAVFSAGGAVAVGGLLVVFDRGGQGRQQRPRRDLDGEGRPGCAFGVAVLVDGQVGVTAGDGQAEDAGGGS